MNIDKITENLELHTFIDDPMESGEPFSTPVELEFRVRESIRVKIELTVTDTGLLMNALQKRMRKPAATGFWTMHAHYPQPDENAAIEVKFRSSHLDNAYAYTSDLLTDDMVFKGLTNPDGVYYTHLELALMDRAEQPDLEGLPGGAQ